MILDQYKVVIEPIKCFQIMNENGEIVNKQEFDALDDQILINSYKIMHLSRTQEHLGFQYQRQGRLLTFPLSMGQEAIQVAIGMNFDQKCDWFVSGYRNNTTMLYLEKPMHEIFQYWAGSETGNITPKNLNITPINVLIATQFSHATGIALANKIQKKSGIVFSDIGDGGTSSGEFYSALNWAGVHELPIIFIIQNNQWAISTPLHQQTKATNLVQKGVAANILSVQVDGNDLLASYQAIKAAKDYLKNHQGPILIEAITYRIGPHTTADDPTLYRSQEYHAQKLKSDPLIRLKKFLIKKGIWSEEQENQLEKAHQKLVKTEFEVALKNLDININEIFDFTYADLPQDLKMQKSELINFYNNQDQSKIIPSKQPNIKVKDEQYQNIK